MLVVFFEFSVIRNCGKIKGVWNFATMLCQFACTKHILYGINTIYITTAGLLLTLSFYTRSASIVTDHSVCDAVLVVGLFLFLVSLLGFYGTAKHHQVVLFFYMVILFTVFVLQFFITIACRTSSSHEALSAVVENGWLNASNQTRWLAESDLQCCGLRNSTDHAVRCEKLPCSPACVPCLDLMVEKMNERLQMFGGIGLFLSFFELVGVWLALRYRNMKDPNVNPVLYFEQ